MNTSYPCILLVALGCAPSESEDGAAGEGAAEPQAWTIVEESGNVAVLEVDTMGTFTGSGWQGDAPGCGSYAMPISGGAMNGQMMTFRFNASYCNGTGAIEADCSGLLNRAFPRGSSAAGSCSGSIDDPLGKRSLAISWAAFRTSGGTCGPDQVALVPKIVGSLTNITWKVTTTCAGPLDGIVCFRGGNQHQCASDVTHTPSSGALEITSVRSGFAVDFLLPDKVHTAEFLYCDGATLSLTTPRQCSDGSAPQLKTVATSPRSSASGPATSSTASITLTDQCDDGQDTFVRLFDLDNGFTWPSPDSYWTLPDQKAGTAMQVDPSLKDFGHSNSGTSCFCGKLGTGAPKT